MANRLWVGLVLVLFGVVGLLAGWRIDQNGGTSGLLAALSLLGFAGGALLLAWRGGEVAVRATGGVLFVAGLAVVLTHHEVWWWLPGGWVIPVTVAALAIAVAGLAVLLLAYGFSVAGLSGALGLFSVTCLALTRLPYIGGPDVSVLRAMATALGAMALTSAVGAAATIRAVANWRSATAVVGVVGAGVTLFTGFDSYDVYASDGHHAAIIVATIVGIVASLALAVIIGRPGIVDVLRQAPSRARRRTATAPATQVPADRADTQETPAERVDAATTSTITAEPQPVTVPAVAAVATAEQSAAVQASVPSSAAPGATTNAMRDRLQTASVAVGLVIGLITIFKELIAVALTIIR